MIPYILLGILLLLSAVFGIVHWRYHPQATAIDSFAELERFLQGGKPTLLQFHAPL